VLSEPEEEKEEKGGEKRVLVGRGGKGEGKSWRKCIRKSPIAIFTFVPWPLIRPRFERGGGKKRREGKKEGFYLRGKRRKKGDIGFSLARFNSYSSLWPKRGGKEGERRICRGKEKGKMAIRVCALPAC